MIYFCADDYGLNDISSMHIQQRIDEGYLNKVSVFPNFDKISLEEIQKEKEVMISLHLNLVEGRCMSDPSEIDLIADNNGNFKHTFGGLFKLSLSAPKKFETQIYKEIKAQVLQFKNLLSDACDFCVDSHQHTHMITAIFKFLIQVLTEENINVKYMRIPAEPILPFIKTPSLYLTYRPINIIKQWLLKFLWAVDKRYVGNFKISTALFLGILFSGEMDEKRISKIIPKYEKIAKKRGMDIEVLFHPGYVDKETVLKNIVFEKFYLSENRKKEFDDIKKLSERSVL